MADIGGVTPERVKNLLSSFLSGISKLSGQSSISRTNQADQLGGSQVHLDPVSAARLTVKNKPDARNRTQFYSRVETYSPLTWFAKPADLSPLVCSRYGWENTDTDMLQCVACKAYLSGQLPKDVATLSYRECYYKLKTNLVAAHEKLCTWSTNPSPESFMLVPYHHKEELLRVIQNGLQTLTSAQRSLPVVSYTSFEKQGLSEERLKEMCDGIKSQFEEDIKTTIDYAVCLYALCGWSYSSEQINILQCNYCRRRIGLWNYKHINETNGTSKGHNGTEMNQNGTESGPSDEETEEPCRKRVKLEKQNFDPVAEHRYWCPWLQTDTSDFNRKTSKTDSAITTSPSSSPLKSPPSDSSPLKSPPSDKSEVVLHSPPTKKNIETETPKVAAWLIVLQLLSEEDILHDWFQSKMKRVFVAEYITSQLNIQSPQLEGVRHLRRVLRECTSPPSSAHIATKIAKS